MYGQTGAWSVPGYTEMRDLGTGSAGRVVLARHDSDDLPVAIKYLSTTLRADLGFVARFRHEARLLAMMEPNPHAARFYEYVEAPHGAAIVMELVDGVSLRAMLRSEGPTGPEAALAVLKGSLLGLASAHGIGVVHRDYKPENVMVTIDGLSKLVDFGIAARTGDGVNAAGTPPYMAPEQWSGGVAGPATDVYAATIVFFECLTGIRPFQAQNIAALAHQHQSMPPPVEQVPPALQGLIQRGMAKQASDRPPSAEAFLRELEAVATDAYGADWEKRGRRRLAALAGLLLPFFPLTGAAPEVGTTLAETSLGGGFLGRAGMKISLTAIGMAVIAGGTVALVNSMTDTTLRAGTSIQSPIQSPSQSASSVDTGTPEPEDTFTEEPTATPSAKPEAPSPTPAVFSRRPTVEPPRPKPTTTPSTKPKPSPKPKPKPKPKPSTSSSPTPEPAITVDDRNSPSDTAPDPRPTTPTETSGPTETSAPSDTQPRGTTESIPAASESPAPDPAIVPVALLAIGLMTTGLVPATLAMKRMTGRHRRRR